MITKFILHGGFSKDVAEHDNSLSYKEIVKDTPEDVKILLVPFAKDADRIPIATERVKNQFLKNKHQIKIQIGTATENEFENQAKEADIVYFHGGTSIKLVEALQKYPDLKKLLKGKVIAGESAGANILTELFYSPNANKVLNGFGLLPLKMIPHYSDKYKGKLDDIRPDLELLLLPEYQFKVFLINDDK